MLPAETLKIIQDTAQRAETPVTLDIPGDGRTAFVANRGVIERLPIEPPPRNHVVRSLADLIEYANRAAIAGDRKPVIWHSPTGVVLVLDDEDRRDRVTFPLSPSEPFLALRKLAKEGAKSWSQKDFLLFLRFTLGCEDAHVMDCFRRLDWKYGQEATGEVRRGRESLGKAIEAQVKGIDDLPEEIPAKAAVYAQPGEDDLRTVRCGLEFDVAGQRIFLVPLPGELERAEEAAQTSIHSRLLEGLAKERSEEDGGAPTDLVPVYSGWPDGCTGSR